MPLINLKVTDAMGSVAGENMRPVTWVVLEEVKRVDESLRGKSLTAGFKALVAGRTLQRV